MTSAGFKHQDDGGNVTLFGTDKQMLFACDQGHWWIVTADSAGSAADDVKPAEAEMRSLRDTFGVDALRQMKLQD